LEHILDPNAELQRVQRLLAPQGVVYVEVPGVKNLARACRMDFLSWLQNAHTTHFSLATLGNLMAKNGFAMHSGTEEACCIYRPRRGDAAPSAVVNDYAEAMDYLLAMEQWRRVIAPWYFPVRRRVIAAGIELLRLLGLHGAARRFYPTMQHEHPLPDDDA
jgi:hypothetical protein